MDILIPDNWLKDFISTKASPQKMAECLSLCGPSIERINEVNGDSVYSIEVTNNRIDSASILGIAREASAILPRFKIEAKFKQLKIKTKLKTSKKVGYLTADVDQNLCPRFTAILIKNVQIGESPKWMKDRLIQVGVRPINNIVDISNYVMHEMGQPLHTFDYDKIRNHKMILRKSVAGELVQTLDGKTHKLLGDDIVIEDGEGRLIDLCGIMGGELSAVDEKTKNVLLFVQSYNSKYVRRTSMRLAHRTEAAQYFEKGIDIEQVIPTTQRSIDLFVELTKGIPEKEILDIYPNPVKQNTVKLNLDFINHLLGVEVSKKEVSNYLNPLGFITKWNSNNLSVVVPTYRNSDVSIPEDIVEEIARIYGYHNLPNKLMDGVIPNKIEGSFNFEYKIKNILKGYGGIEIYTLSLVSKSQTDEGALKLRNPLGSDYEYLRTSLLPSLIAASKENVSEKEEYHLFEISHIYVPRKNDLPEEKMMLGGILVNSNYRTAKGIVEALTKELNVTPSYKSGDGKYFLPSQRLEIYSEDKLIGVLGVLENSENIYYEFDIEQLKKSCVNRRFTDIPKYPPQIEDHTFELPQRTQIGPILDSLRKIKLVSNVLLKDIYNNSYTIRVYYQDQNKTLTDSEVEVVRKEIIKTLQNKFGINLKV